MTNDSLTEFSNLVRMHLNSVIRYVIFLSREPEEAQDITQEIFLKAWQSFDPGRKNSFKAWIMTIARNLVIDRKRRRLPRVEYICDYSNESSSAGSGEHVNPGGHFPAGLRLLAKLPTDQQEIVFMRYVEQIPYQEMSQITGKSEEALRKIVSRAVSAIRKEAADGTLQQSK